MKITQKQLLQRRHAFMSIPDFIANYHKGLTTEAVVYQMKKAGGIDYYQYKPGHSLFVVLTANTLKYVPTIYRKRIQK